MILVNTYTEMETYLSWKDTAEFSFIWKDKTTYNVLVTKVYESTIKKYPEVSSTGYKFTITFNGNRVDSKVYRLKSDIIQCLKISLGELWFKEKINSNLWWDVSVSFDSQDIPVNFDTSFDNIDSKKSWLEERIKKIKEENPHKTFNISTIYARIVCDDLWYKWIWEKWTNWWLLKFDRVWGFYMIYKNKQEEVLAKYNKAKEVIASKNYPFKVIYKENKNNYIIEVENYKE